MLETVLSLSSFTQPSSSVPPSSLQGVCFAPVSSSRGEAWVLLPAVDLEGVVCFAQLLAIVYLVGHDLVKHPALIMEPDSSCGSGIFNIYLHIAGSH